MKTSTRVVLFIFNTKKATFSKNIAFLTSKLIF